MKYVWMSISSDANEIISWEFQSWDQAYMSTSGFSHGAAFWIPSRLARVWTNAMGIIKKKVRKKNATAVINLLTVRETYGIGKFRQYTSRGSGAHSVNQSVGFLVCWVCAQTAAAHLVLNETNAAGMMALGSFVTFSLSSTICKITSDHQDNS